MQPRKLLSACDRTLSCDFYNLPGYTGTYILWGPIATVMLTNAYISGYTNKKIMKDWSAPIQASGMYVESVVIRGKDC